MLNKAKHRFSGDVSSTQVKTACVFESLPEDKLKSGKEKSTTKQALEHAQKIDSLAHESVKV